MESKETRLRAALERAEDALQWASGSADFNTGGVARRGWLKLGRPALEQVRAALRCRS